MQIKYLSWELIICNVRTHILTPYLSYEYQKRHSSQSTLLLRRQADDGTVKRSCDSYAASEPLTDCDRTWKLQRPSCKGPLHHRAAKLNDFVSCCETPPANQSSTEALIRQKVRRTHQQRPATLQTLTDPLCHTMRIHSAPGWQAARWRIVIVKLLQMFNPEFWQSV